MENDGGHVYPSQGLGQGGLPLEQLHPGITVRNYFAIRLMQKLMDRRLEAGYDEMSAIAESYRIADEMIKMGTR